MTIIRNVLFVTFFIYQLASSCGYQSSSSAFLFSLVNKPGWAPVRLSPPGGYGSYQQAMYGCSSYGPTFGNGNDIYISDYASSNTNSVSDLGYAYSAPTGYSYGSFSRSFLAGSRDFQPDEIEVFYETT